MPEVNIGKLIMSLTDDEIDELFLRFVCDAVAQVTREGGFEADRLGVSNK